VRAEKGTTESSEWCSGAAGAVQFTRHRPAATIVTAASCIYCGVGPGFVDMWTSHNNLTKPSSPHLSTYRLVSSSPGHSTVFALVFPIPSSLMSRVRGDVATNGLRAQATEMTSHSHQRTTVTKTQTCGSQSTSSTLRQSHSSRNFKLPLRNPLMRLGDPVPILQDSRVFHAPPPSTSNAERYRLLQKQITTKTDYYKNNPMSTHLHFIFGIT
jgi:hypothetical protein